VGRHPGIEGNLLDFVSGQKPLRNELADGRNGGFTYVEITDNYPILVAASPLPVIREQAERFRRYLADDANEFGRNWLEEQQRRLDAVHSYVKSRQVRAEVSQCQRWVELRIGEWCATCAVRNQLELGNTAGGQESSELNKWSGEYPQHRGYVKPTKPAARG
jgi:hypothetical protein